MQNARARIEKRTKGKLLNVSLLRIYYMRVKAYQYKAINKQQLKFTANA